MKLESYRSYKLTDFKPEMAKIGLLYINMGMEVHRRSPMHLNKIYKKHLRTSAQRATDIIIGIGR